MNVDVVQTNVVPVSIDECFEIRHGEQLGLVSHGEAIYSVGLFLIPSPGELVKDVSGRPVCCVMARKVGEAWQWVPIGAGTKRVITEMLANKNEIGRWHGMAVIGN